MLSVAATYVFTMVLPYIKIGDVGFMIKQLCFLYHLFVYDRPQFQMWG